MEELSLEALFHRGQELFPDLSFVSGSCSAGNTLSISRRDLHQHSPAGLISRARIVVTEDKRYDFQVLLRSKEAGYIDSVEKFIELCSIINPSGDYKFCPGINTELYETRYLSVIRYDLKSVRKTSDPIARIDSAKCMFWHKLARNSSLIERSMDAVLCQACKRLRSDLEQRLKTSSKVTVEDKENRVQPSSHFPIKYLSPDSQKEKKRQTQLERKRDKKMLKKYECVEVSLNDEQHDDMCAIIDKISQSDFCLNDLFLEGDKHGVGQVMKDLWEMDKRKIKEEFMRDQKKNTTGTRGNRWSLVTIRMALAVFVRSPAAYEALKGFGLMQLPSRSTLQAYTGAFLDEAGASEFRMADEKQRFEEYKLQRVSDGKPLPQGDGVLIFDEVKVVCRLMWNSRCQKIIGLAMSPDDLASLQDVYQLIECDAKTQQTSYIMQFLWRDLTSGFDAVGPYFTSSNTFENKSILSCLLESLRNFHVHGFKTCLLVCDATTANVSTIKATCGVSGAYGQTSDPVDPHKVAPFFQHPFDPTRKLYWMICPSHQLKNMINALFSSRDGGTKQFHYEGVAFGWKAIEEMYARECSRRTTGHARMVPKLRESHILRDSWTKLNVHPAKIMQQEQVLTELFHYVNQSPKPDDAYSVQSTLNYLEACGKLFENGFLSAVRVRESRQEVLINIQAGYHFFSEWLNSLLKDPDYNPVDNEQRKFLAWQTWDNLRIDVYGFAAFCEWFFKEYPTYFIVPIRITGSAVETLFAQYKYLSGNKLDAVNYTTARSKYICKKKVEATHHSGMYYRDMPLNVPSAPLEKKKYDRQKKKE